MAGSLPNPGIRATALSLSHDDLYPQASGASVLAEVIERLGSGRPVDASEIDLASYRGLVPPWNDWEHVTARGRAWAETLADLLLRLKEKEG